MRNGIIGSGNWVYDKVKTLDRWPGEGNLSNIISIVNAAGGGPANVLFDLAAMDKDLPLYASGLTGKDSEGESLIEESRKRNIDVTYLKQIDGVSTSFTDVMSAEGKRTFFHCRGANDKLDYQDQQMSAKIKAHPFQFFALYFRPYVLFPDIPSFLENLGITKTGRNTTDVLNRQGVFAAVKHYFGGHWGALAVTIPLIALAGLLYLFGFGEVIRRCFMLDYVTVLLFLLLAEYYLFLPGSVPMPRYQLPALPFLCVMTASLFQTLSQRFVLLHALFRVKQ